MIGQCIRLYYFGLLFGISDGVMVRCASASSYISYYSIIRRTVLLPDKMPPHSTVPALRYVLVPPRNRCAAYALIALRKC